MRTSQYSTAALIDLFRQQTVATLAEVMTALGTGARRTAFRKLKEIPYRASYSHRGRYYTLDELIDGPEQQKSPPKSAFVLAPALRLLVALVAALRCLRLAIPCRHPTVRSCASSDALPHRPGLCYAGVPPALPSWRQRDLPGSWATRSTFALLSDPGRAGVPSRFGTPVLSPAVPALSTTKTPTRSNLSRLNHTASAVAVYASPTGVAPDQRKTRFRLPATLYRVGLATHRVATKSF